MSEKLYCGRGRTIKTQYGQQLKLSLTAEDLAIMQRNLDNGWVNIDVKRKRDENAKFPYYMEIDTWKPNNQKSQPNKPQQPEDEPLPF